MFLFTLPLLIHNQQYFSTKICHLKRIEEDCPPPYDVKHREPWKTGCGLGYLLLICYFSVFIVMMFRFCKITEF